MIFGHGLAQPVAVANIAEASIGKTDDEIQAYFEEAIEKVNAELPAYERISSLLLVRDPWSVDAGQLTPTLKIKRKVLEQEYASRLGESVSGVLIDF